MKEKQRQKITRTATQTSHPAAATPYDYLDPSEEKVIRMRYGLSEADDKALEYAVGASDDSRMKVTLMEACNIVDLGGEVPVAHGRDGRMLHASLTRFDLDY